MRNESFRTLSDLVDYVNGPNHSIIAVDTVTEKVTVQGDLSLRLNPGDGFDITGSTGNDGAYVVAVAGITITAEGNTEITVTGDIVDATVDGTAVPAGIPKAKVQFIRELDGRWNLMWWV